MLNLFKARPLIDQSSADWIFDTYAWALEYFDSNVFFTRSRLIQPSNEFFPGRVDSVHAKAENIFSATLSHAGLSHWPLVLQAPEQFQNSVTPLLNIHSFERNSGESKLPSLRTDQPLHLSYNPQQTLKPEDLSSSFAHNIAQQLAFQSQILPPGGCGSCYNAQANRQATLTENDVMFALALFCRLKEIPSTEATRFLKKHLRSSFKQATKQINAQPQEKLDRLLAFKKVQTLEPKP